MSCLHFSFSVEIFSAVGREFWFFKKINFCEGCIQKIFGVRSKMGTTACKRLCVKRDEYKRYILQGRMKNFDEYMEERQEPFVYFNDYEKMNEEFIKKYKKQFPLRKEIEFKIEENLEHDT